MRKQKFYLAIDDYERSVIINSLNNLRHKLIADGRYTDAVDELIHNRVMEIINTDLIYV